MSKYDVSDFDADELNHAIDDTNFPHTTSASMSSANNGSNDENEGARRHTASSMPMPVKRNGHITKSFSDDVFDVPGTPKTPRSIPTPGNCECL